MATPSQNIDQHIARLNDWRGDRLDNLRKLINETNNSLRGKLEVECTGLDV